MFTKDAQPYSIKLSNLSCCVGIVPQLKKRSSNQQPTRSVTFLARIYYTESTHNGICEVHFVTMHNKDAASF